MRYVLVFPPDTVILSRRRRILVHGTYETNTIKYRSAGRLPIGSQGSVECLFGLQRRTPLRHFVALFAPLGSMLLDFQVASLPYSTAITDSLNSQVATAPLRIQFAGVTPVPLPPLTGHYGCQAACHMSQRASAAKTSPSGGSGAKHQKGGISLAPRARLACFPFARQGGCLVLS